MLQVFLWDLSEGPGATLLELEGVSAPRAASGLSHMDWWNSREKKDVLRNLESLGGG